ncbi:MAG: long-chain fatty acid--CoA ligase [Candidatus Parabeggiatoa sp. nov. 1]|nr:MAG: long-chain fatty acid--CoA ligase [Gammaproteobacteria bacterium]
MNIAQHLERAQRLFPNKPALLFEGQSFTYRELDEMSNRVANGLAGLGVSCGDRVALFLPNIPPFVIVYLGIQKIGAVAVSINSTFKAQETKVILTDSGASVVVTTESLRTNVPAEELPQLNTILIAEGEAQKTDIDLSDWMAKASPNAQMIDRAHDDPAVILYTSGTTGFPKGATLSHGNVILNIRMCVYTFRTHPDDRILLFLPIFHNFGQNAAFNTCFEACATLVLHREFEIESVLESIVRNKVTTFFGVPTIYTLLYDKASAEQMRSVRYYISAAATLPVVMAKKWHDKFGVFINNGYGLSETSQVCFNHFFKHKPGDSVGSPLEGIDVKIVNAEGREVASGEVGEVAIRGSNVMLGYWNRPAETAEAIKEGWFHTGDIGKMDDEGYFYIVDRVKDMINVGGLKVYPSEVENFLYQHPAVAEAAVYGVQEPLLGEQVRASVVLKPQQVVTEEEIITFCRQQMADFKVPSIIEFVDSLPKSKTGKILKRMLREKVQKPHDSEEPAVPSVPHSDIPSHSQQAIKATENWIADWLAKRLGLAVEAIKTDQPFEEYGMTSALAVHLAQELGDWLGRSLPPVIAWNFSTIEAMASHLAGKSLETSDQQPNVVDNKSAHKTELSALSDSDLATLLAAEIEAAKKNG